MNLLSERHFFDGKSLNAHEGNGIRPFELSVLSGGLLEDMERFNGTLRETRNDATSAFNSYGRVGYKGDFLTRAGSRHDIHSRQVDKWKRHIQTKS